MPLSMTPQQTSVFLITQLAERCDYARTANRNRVTVELPVC